MQWIIVNQKISKQPVETNIFKTWKHNSSSRGKSISTFEEHSSDLMAYINGTDSENTFIALIIIVLLDQELRLEKVLTT